MMIRATLCDAFLRLLAGEQDHLPLPRFLNAFYTAHCEAEQRELIAEEPPMTGNARWDAEAAAIAHYLSNQYALGAPPDWAFGPERFLDEPWFAADASTPGFVTYLTFASPAEYKMRNIYTEERPLRRATQALGDRRRDERSKHSATTLASNHQAA
jgi:hypothetical protein